MCIYLYMILKIWNVMKILKYVNNGRVGDHVDMLSSLQKRESRKKWEEKTLKKAYI